MPDTHDIRACNVQIGDELFNNMNGKMPPCYWWHRVTSIKDVGDNYVEIGVGGWAGWYTRKHRYEGVTVRRQPRG